MAVIDVTPRPPKTGGEVLFQSLTGVLEARFDAVRYRFALNTEASVLLYPFYPLAKPISESVRRKVDVLFAPWCGVLPVAADMIYIFPPAVQAGDPLSLKSRLGIGAQSPRNLWPPPMMWLYYNRLARGLLDQAALRALDSIGTILVLNRELQREVLSEFGRESKVVPPCLSKETFALLTESRGTPERKKQVVTISRLVPEKRLDVIVSIANQLPDVKFVIAGREGVGSRVYCRTLSEQNSARNVTLRTSIDERTKVDLLRNSAVFLNASRNEGFLLTVLEAVLAGAYPLVHASGGPLDYLPREHLFLTEEEAIDRIRGVLSHDWKVDPELATSIRSLADPARFERQIVEATEEAARNRRR